MLLSLLLGRCFLLRAKLFLMSCLLVHAHHHHLELVGVGHDVAPNQLHVGDVDDVFDGLLSHLQKLLMLSEQRIQEQQQNPQGGCKHPPVVHTEGVHCQDEFDALHKHSVCRVGGGFGGQALPHHGGHHRTQYGRVHIAVPRYDQFGRAHDAQEIGC